MTDSEVNRRRRHGSPSAAWMPCPAGRVLGRRESSEGATSVRPVGHGQALDHEVPDHVGERLLGPVAARRSREPSAPRMTAALSVGLEARPAPTSLTTSRSQPLRASLARPCVERVAVVVAGLGGEADDDLPRPLRCADQLGQDVGVARPARSARVAAPVFLILWSARRRAEVGDRGGHHDGVGVRRRLRSIAARSSSAEPTRDDLRRRPGRAARRWRRPGSPRRRGRRRCGERVALPAGRAVAEEAHRVEGSRVPPAVTTTWRPARSSGSSTAPRARTRRTSSRELVGLGQPARPGVGAGQPADRRVDDQRAAAAQRRDVGLGRRVLPHLGVHRRREHHRAARGEQGVVSRSSARPCGGLGQQVGGGGRDDDQVGLLAEATCGTSWTSSQTSVVTGWPDSAAQVAAPTKCSALAVGTTRTSWPVSVSRRSSSHAL